MELPGTTARIPTDSGENVVVSLVVPLRGTASPSCARLVTILHSVRGRSSSRCLKITRITRVLNYNLNILGGIIPPVQKSEQFTKLSIPRLA